MQYICGDRFLRVSFRSPHILYIETAIAATGYVQRFSSFLFSVRILICFDSLGYVGHVQSQQSWDGLCVSDCYLLKKSKKGKGLKSRTQGSEQTCVPVTPPVALAGSLRGFLSGCLRGFTLGLRNRCLRGFAFALRDCFALALRGRFPLRGTLTCLRGRRAFLSGFLCFL